MYGYNIDSGLNLAAKRVNTSLSSVRSQASEGFGLGGQVNDRPWLMIGAALAAGFVLGSLLGGGDDDDRDDRKDYRNERADQDRRSDGGYNKQYLEQQDFMQKAAQHAGYEYGGPSSYGNGSSYGNSSSYNSSRYDTSDSYSNSSSYSSTLPSTSYSANTGASTSNFAQSTPSQPKQPGPIASKVNEQMDGVIATAGEAVRNFLRDTIRDAVPSMRDQVDALDRRDGRTPGSSGMSGSSTSSTSKARLYDVDDTNNRTTDPSLT